MRRRTNSTKFKNLALALGCFLLSVFLVLALFTHNASDPSFNNISDSKDTANMMGVGGAYVSDLLLQLFGVVSIVLALFPLKISINFLSPRHRGYNVYLKIVVFIVFLISACTLLSKTFYCRNFSSTLYGSASLGNTTDIIAELELINRKKIGWGGALGYFMNNILTSLPCLAAQLLYGSLSLLLLAILLDVRGSDVVSFAKKFFKFIKYLTLLQLKLVLSGLKLLMPKDFRSHCRNFVANLRNKFSRSRCAKQLGNKVNYDKFERQWSEKHEYAADKGNSTMDAAGTGKNIREIVQEVPPAIDEFSFDENTRGYDKNRFTALGQEENDGYNSSGSSIDQGSRGYDFDNARNSMIPINRHGEFNTNDVVGTGATHGLFSLFSKTTPKNEYKLPPLDLLNSADDDGMITLTREELREQASDLLRVLREYKISGRITSVRAGPIITLHEFEPAAGTKSSRIIGCADDIARNLKVKSTRISVIPERNVVGIELPNRLRNTIFLRELLESKEYGAASYNLPIVLGTDIAGEPVVMDLAKAPHLLIAGTTGSGKSVSINTMILSLLYKFTPDECKMLMIDPKMLELSVYDGIPHLLTPVVTDPKKAVLTLKWVVSEMETRYRNMSGLGVRNIYGYNEKARQALKEGKTLISKILIGYDEYGEPIYDNRELETKQLPFIVVVVDEMADLMITAGKDIEALVQRIAQMARAAGIHIIMATQRPSVDIITGVIKANFPSRISFLVSSRIDSKVILGEQGAEQLLGMGDMLYMPNGGKINRAHGPFVSDDEVERVVKYIVNQDFKPTYIRTLAEADGDSSFDGGNFDISINDGRKDGDEALYQQAVDIVRRDKKISISYVQRQLRIGYNKAANFIERMEKDGIVSPVGANGKRELLQ